MTKKHFIALADAIKQAPEYTTPFTYGQLEVLANFCESQNSNFNRQRWMEYVRGECSPSGGKVA
jgi:hypothetical protein